MEEREKKVIFEEKINKNVINAYESAVRQNLK